MRRRRGACSVVGAALICVGVGVGTGAAAVGPPPAAAQEAPGGGRLVAAGDCAALLGWYVERGVRRVGPYGWDSPVLELDWPAFSSLGGPQPLAARTTGPAMTQAPSSATGTNVQEAGVDEPDLVKTDGELLVRVRGSRLTTYDVTGEAPRRLASLDLPELHGAELLLVGSRVVVLGTEPPAPAAPLSTPPGTRALVVDLADPAAPRLVDDASYAAELVTARQHGDVVRLVLSAGLAQLDFVRPGAFRSPREALRANLRIVRESTLADWLPGVTSGDDTQPLLGCGDVHVPPGDGSGPGTLTVVGFDPAAPQILDAEALATASRVAYLSTDRMYVASEAQSWLAGWAGPSVVRRDVARPNSGGWGGAGFSGDWAPYRPWPWPDGVTRLHAFALDGLATTYLASGKVAGRVADRWAMDEADGVLRVAVGPSMATGDHNAVVTVAQVGDQLVQVGRADRLGAGEEITAVRWFDDLAIVVTFRRTDPLYAVDLADPTRPRLVGELKIPGFSEYLHPLGPRRLLGMGQHALPSGVSRGAQAALFDLADVSRPRRVDVVGYGKATQALAAWDPRQFLWLPDEQTALTVVARGWDGRAGWVSVLRPAGERLENRMVRVEPDGQLTDVRLVPVSSGRVALVTGDSVEFLPLDVAGAIASGARRADR